MLAAVNVEGKLIEAIKAYRSLTGAGLKESKDAIDAAFAGMSDLTVRAIAYKIGNGYPDGSGWELSDSQEGRKMMYGFEASY